MVKEVQPRVQVVPDLPKWTSLRPNKLLSSHKVQESNWTTTKVMIMQRQYTKFKMTHEAQPSKKAYWVWPKGPLAQSPLLHNWRLAKTQKVHYPNFSNGAPRLTITWPSHGVHNSIKHNVNTLQIDHTKSTTWTH